jgi:uncharacterized membrane protein
MTFVYYLSLSFVAAMLLASGIGHLLGWGRFGALVRSHRVVPASLTTAVALLVGVFELASAGIALAALSSSAASTLAVPLFVVCAAAGCVFVWYVRQLLRNPAGIASCGCSPLPGPLTPASLVPASGLLLVSTAGLAATSLVSRQPLSIAYQSLGIATALPVAWGVTLAALVMLFPASMPRLAADRR